MLLSRLETFVEEDCIPSEEVFDRQVLALEAQHGSRWAAVPEVVEQLKKRARSLGLWNLFMPSGLPGSVGVSLEEYAAMSEVMGRSFLAPEACNCSAPDTGNCEVLAKFGSSEQQQEWLTPLLQGISRSAFLMTEPDVASSDATNISCMIEKQGDEYVITGRKWWSTGAMDPRCRMCIVMGRMKGSDWDSQPVHCRHSMVIVPMPCPGLSVDRALQVFGYDDAPHGHAQVSLHRVHVPVANLLLGEGRGFEIAQSRLGPGRVHHCMRAIGLAERSLSAAVRRTQHREAFGGPLSEQGLVQNAIAQSRVEIDAARQLVVKCAQVLDYSSDETTSLSPSAQQLVSEIKIFVPEVACRVIDRCIQVHGGLGVCQDTFLAAAYAHMRTLRIADGPDEVHIRVVAKQEYRRRMESRAGRSSHIKTPSARL
jgi:acyl-CoA dehydrogenase